MTHNVAINKDSVSEEYPDECYINAIGKDGLIHTALSWKDTCICGTVITIKNPNNAQMKDKFNCYECTY